MLEIGTEYKQTMRVEEKDTASVYKSGTLEVFATPAMIAFIEKTSMEGISPFLEEGQTTVGTKLEIEHVSATPVGAEVCCESKLIEIDRKRLVFNITVTDKFGLIGKGKHERFVVDSDKFMKKTADKFK